MIPYFVVTYGIFVKGGNSMKGGSRKTLSSAILKGLAETQMKADANLCRWCLYQPVIPQKIRERYQK